MPINIPDSLPAKSILDLENIFAIDQNRATHQDIRPLRILILNLMPKKIETETQLLRLLSNSPLQVDIDFMKISSHISRNTSQDHLLKFYDTFDHLKDQKYDGMIITGAPVEQMDFEEVDYWKELSEIMTWSKTHVYSVFHICWGAQAGLYYHYGIEKIALDKKVFGIYPQTITKKHWLTNGFDEVFYTPHSRHTCMNEEMIKNHPDLQIVSTSNMSGINIVVSKDERQVFVLGHFEYDRVTLANEYFRDVKNGDPIEIPYNYFPDNKVSELPLHTWKAHANLLYLNWLHNVYQMTPFDLNTL